jgi:hypothetical protein
MKKFKLCPYHEDSLGWHDCTDFWCRTEFLDLLSDEELREVQHCQIDEARKDAGEETP